MRILILSLLLAFSTGVPANAPVSAEDTVREALQSLAGMVSECRLQLAADPGALRGIVDHHLRPRADVLYAGQLILGRHWAQADADQRRRFAEALYGTLANRYATGLLLLTERNVVVVGSGESAEQGPAQVELRVQTGLATPLPVFLQMRQGNARWRIFDARWEGQSYVLSLRHAVSQQIRRDGLDAVIRRLEATAGTTAGPPEERPSAAGRCLSARRAR
jgi:phospholipid transport system substrate-binding protein